LVPGHAFLNLFCPLSGSEQAKEKQMPSHPTLRRHAALVDRMAGAMGVDLEAAVMRGQLAPDDLPYMVLRCTGCANPDGCEAFLQKAAAAPKPGPTPPYFCRNAWVFDDLGRC
jgi:hypothetical protein